MLFPFDRVVMLVTPTSKDRVENFNTQKTFIENLEMFKSIYIPNVNNIAWTLKNNNSFIWNGYGNGTALNCMINHYTIVKQALLDGIDNIMVIEDDVDFIKYKDNIEDVFNAGPLDYDIIRYCWNEDYTKYYHPNNAEIYTESYQQLWGAQCYVLSKNGMKYYIEYFDKLPGCSDVPLFNLNSSDNIKQYFCNIPICHELKGTINTIIQTN